MAMIPVNTIFLDAGKEREKNESYFCDWWYDESNEIKYFTPSLT
jgi:hypothetical protein